MSNALRPPPPGITWTFAQPVQMEQCCWCGEPLLPGDSAMLVIVDGESIWSHYDSRPCYGTRERTQDNG